MRQDLGKDPVKYHLKGGSATRTGPLGSAPFPYVPPIRRRISLPCRPNGGPRARTPASAPNRRRQRRVSHLISSGMERRPFRSVRTTWIQRPGGAQRSGTEQVCQGHGDQNGKECPGNAHGKRIYKRFYPTPCVLEIGRHALDKKHEQGSIPLRYVLHQRDPRTKDTRRRRLRQSRSGCMRAANARPVVPV